MANSRSWCVRDLSGALRDEDRHSLITAGRLVGMIVDGIELHNVAAVAEVPGSPGLRLQRLSDTVRGGLNPLAAEVALSPTHVEFRMVASAPVVRLRLWSGPHHEYATVLQGDHVVGEHCIEPGSTACIELAAGHDQQPPRSAGRGFAACVRRLRLSGTGRVHLVGCDAGGGSLRPPDAHERPARRWLAYGSSITQGFSAPRLAAPWIQVAANALGVDVLNLGSGGSCHADVAIAEHIAASDAWHLATCELGINLVDQPISLDVFAQRVERFAHAARRHPRRVVALITAFPARDDWLGGAAGARLAGLRAVVRAVHGAAALPNLYLLEGGDLLSDPSGLSADLVHPSDVGHARIGVEAARRLAPILPCPVHALA